MYSHHRSDNITPRNDADANLKVAKNDGQIFKAYDSGGGSRVALYVCSVRSTNGLGFFTSTDQSCEGKTSQYGPIGYLDSAQSASSPNAVYRCVKAWANDYMDTKNQTECTSNGYTVERTLGYAPN